MDCEHGFKSLRIGGNCPWCDLAALRAKLEAFKTGGCPCKLSKSWDGESHHNTCPEIRDELERGYCDRIKALTAALSRYVPCRVCKIHGYGQCAECKATMALLSPAPRPEDEKCWECNGTGERRVVGGPCPKCKPSDEKPKEGK